mmetsp:Transcript_50001/g.127276  ORF Transcript_50001/g.127276 Transcript_50001/m.127276 type:complete len:322 (+) Transcript_50001:67-1032(+)
MALNRPSAMDPCKIEEDLVFKDDFEAFLKDQRNLFEMSGSSLLDRSPQVLTPPELFKAAVQPVPKLVAAQPLQKLVPEEATISKLRKLRDEERMVHSFSRPARASSSTAASTATCGRSSSGTSTSGSSLSLPVRQCTETSLARQQSTAGGERPISLLAMVEPLSEGSDGEIEQLVGTQNAQTSLVSHAAMGRGSPVDQTSTSSDTSADKHEAARSDISTYGTAARRHWMLGCTGSGGVEAECTAMMHQETGPETPSTSSPPSTAMRHSTGSDFAADDVRLAPPSSPSICPPAPSPKRLAAPPASSRRKHWMLGASSQSQAS